MKHFFYYLLLLISVIAFETPKANAQVPSQNSAVVKKNQPIQPPALADIMLPSGLSEKAALESSPELPAAMPEAQAAPIPPLDPEQFPILAKIKQNAKDVSYDYLGQRLGLDVWLISGPSVMQIVYTLPNNQGAIIGGSLVNADGQDIGGPMQQNFIQKNPERAEDMIAKVSRASKEVEVAQVPSTPQTEHQNNFSKAVWTLLQQDAAENHPGVGKITFGDSKNTSIPSLYVLLDPYQEQSIAVWPKLLEKVEQGKVNLMVLPIAATNPNKLQEIAQSMIEQDPQNAWKTLITEQKLTTPVKEDRSGLFKLRANLALIQGIGLRQVPVFLYRFKDTETVRIMTGIPKSWEALWEEMLVIP